MAVAVTVTKTVVVCKCGQLHFGSRVMCCIDCEQFATVTVIFELSELVFHD